VHKTCRKPSATLLLRSVLLALRPPMRRIDADKDRARAKHGCFSCIQKHNSPKAFLTLKSTTRRDAPCITCLESHPTLGERQQERGGLPLGKHQAGTAARPCRAAAKPRAARSILQTQRTPHQRQN